MKIQSPSTGTFESSDQPAPDSSDQTSFEAPVPNRRTFLRRGAAVVGGAALLASCTGSDDVDAAAAASNAPSTGGPSLFDQIRDEGTVRLGADLTFPPLQMKDDDGNPSGYTVDLARQMLTDLNPDVEIEFVEITFGELFGALAAGRFDLSAIGATILPSRAQQVMFADEPLFIESNIILRNTGSSVASVEDLNASGVTIAVLAGSAQEASARALFPEAELRSLEQQPAVQEAATGRADVVLLGEFNVAAALEENSDLEVLEGPPVFADINTWFMPIGDFKMQAYINNWLRYNIIRGTLASKWIELVAGPAQAQGIASTPVFSPYLGAGQVLGESIG
jgi:polar amino acid transport system substrate-binding protein